MLVLTRKKSQLIQIGDNIVIKVIRTGPGSVKLGIDAPGNVRVIRGELNEELTKSYEEAGESPATEQEKVETADVSSRRSERLEEEESVIAKALSRRKGRTSAV
ncbi:MAG: carbon storage regulator [Planctomycetaceae bacterium]|nr:carbon storage regulator [Planctomycetaceae bacterium]